MNIINYFLSIEFFALLSGLMYLVLIIKEVRWAWPLAFFTGIVVAVIAFNKHLYMEMALQIYYVLMAVIGWFSWRNSSSNKEKPIRRMRLTHHLFLIICSFLLTFIFTWFLTHYTDQQYAFLDSLTTIFSLTVTWMVTQKILENWLYWIIINALNVYLMMQNEMYWLAILMVIYTFMAVQGFVTWNKKYQTNNE